MVQDYGGQGLVTNAFNHHKHLLCRRAPLGRRGHLCFPIFSQAIPMSSTVCPAELIPTCPPGGNNGGDGGTQCSARTGPPRRSDTQRWPGWRDEWPCPSPSCRRRLVGANRPRATYSSALAGGSGRTFSLSAADERERDRDSPCPPCSAPGRSVSEGRSLCPGSTILPRPPSPKLRAGPIMGNPRLT